MVKHEINTDEARAIKQVPRSIPLTKRNDFKVSRRNEGHSNRTIVGSGELSFSSSKEERWQYKILRRLQEVVKMTVTRCRE